MTLTLWSRSPEVAATMREGRENTAYLPGFSLPTAIEITADAEAAVSEAEIVLSVVPSEHLRATYEYFAPLLRADQIIVSATKGIEDHTLLRMSEVIHETVAQQNLDLPVGVLERPLVRPGSRRRLPHRAHHCLHRQRSRGEDSARV